MPDYAPLSANGDTPHYVANYSPERRATALSWIRGNGLPEADVSEGAKLAAIVGLLICDEQGRMSEVALISAMQDPSVLQSARALLTEAANA